MKSYDRYSFFDTIRGEVRNEDYLLYFLMSESVKKVAITNYLSIKEVWHELSSEDALTALEKFFRKHDYEDLAKTFDSLDRFSKKFPKALVDFSIANQHEPLVNKEHFIELYEYFEANDQSSGYLGIQNIIFELMNLLAGVHQAQAVYDGILSQPNSLLTAHLLNPKAELYGQALSKQKFVLTEMISFLYLENKAKIKFGNVLLEPKFTCTSRDLQQFDSVVMVPPPNYSLKENFSKDDKFNRFTYGELGIRDGNWGFLLHAIASLKDTGRACILVFASQLFTSGKGEVIRRELLEQDLIEGVIQLPSFILSRTSIAPFLLILNKNKQANDLKKVKLLNASNLFYQAGRRKVLSIENIHQITREYFEGNGDGEILAKVTSDEILNNSSNLMPERYLIKLSVELPGMGIVEINEKIWGKKDTIPIEKLANISAGINAKISEHGEKIRVIKARDIQDGEIHLESIEEQLVKDTTSHKKGLVQSGDLLMLSKGTNIKMAVMPEIDQDYFASTNLMIIRTGEEINPYFLQFYLESPFGQLELSKIQTGSVIQMWPLKEFKKIQIPKISKEEQDRIVQSIFRIKRRYNQAIADAEKEKQQAQIDIYKQIGLLEIIKNNY